MGDGQGSSGGILALIALAACAVMYYVFHIAGFGWILKAIVALLILSVILCIAVTGWVIYDAIRDRKERDRLKEKERQEAELQKFDRKSD